MRRRFAPAVALALACALACGGGGSKSGGTGKTCTAAVDCGGALLCIAGKCAAQAPASAACTPPSRPTPVLGDPMTAADPGASCQTSIRAPVYPAAQSLGQLQVGEEAHFQVPEGTWSISVVSQEVPGSAPDVIQYQSVSFPNSVVPTSVTAPDGRVFYDDSATAPKDGNGYSNYTGLLGYYGGFTPVSGALTLPNTSPGLDISRSAGGLPPGTWKFTVNDYAYECVRTTGCTGGSSSGRYDVQVLTRAGPITSTGTLDLDVYVASASTTAAGLARDPHLARLFQTVATVLGNAGLCLGSVVLHDLPSWAQAKYANVNIDSTGPCDPLSQLFTLAEAQRPSIHLFLVDELTVTTNTTDPFSIVGIDGSIPGPSGVPGTVNGGAVVTLADLGQGSCGSTIDIAHCGTDHMAYIVAHEASHWLGLYHTTERSGTMFDPLTDTPTCACANCAPAADRATCENKLTDPSQTPFDMTGADCSQQAATCSGSSNLMFWLLDDTRSNGSVTPQQSEVMRLNPAVR
ncbi:zinc metalloprotease [Anaeromyxobacter terrae]|uniref:hypothetical protein n=1 Tax=Anaeromyxobacter terrae TaxID=2925406 RepID=UPI001F59EEC0|nr:hypothetical protein [Anaeromyxobacter sp. SG22]